VLVLLLIAIVQIQSLAVAQLVHLLLLRDREHLAARSSLFFLAYLLQAGGQGRCMGGGVGRVNLGRGRCLLGGQQVERHCPLQRAEIVEQMQRFALEGTRAQQPQVQVRKQRILRRAPRAAALGYPISEKKKDQIEREREREREREKREREGKLKLFNTTNTFAARPPLRPPRCPRPLRALQQLLLFCFHQTLRGCWSRQKK
jgi:hypothetical protein